MYLLGGFLGYQLDWSYSGVSGAAEFLPSKGRWVTRWKTGRNGSLRCGMCLLTG